MTLEEVRRAAKPYLAARKKLEEKQLALVMAILSAHARGETVRSIAEAAGISFQRVQQILAGNRP